jgi:hypothetical protein
VTETAEKVTSVSEVTPSGIEIEYSWEPKRQYRIRWAEGAEHMTVEGDPEHNPGVQVPAGPRPYMGMHDWRVVPSVTTVLETLQKGGLSWWGQEVGVEGVLELYRRGFIHAFSSLDSTLAINPSEGYQAATVDGVVDLLKKQKLTINHTLGKAAKRGTAVHDALEVWAKTGSLPHVSTFPPEEQGYVQGLLFFLADVSSAEPVASEVMVGSLANGFAGRYDIRFKTTEEHAVVVHRTPVKGPQYAVLKPGLYLGDLKTKKDIFKPIYESYQLQVAGYEGASIECGYELTDAQGVLYVAPDGTYKFMRSKAVFQDFLNVLPVYHSLEGLKK